MFIPRHWARARRIASRPDDDDIELTAWGWSADDRGEAAAKAEERLAVLLARVEKGDGFPERYPYGARPLREEIVEEVRAGQEVAFLVTRNGYGSLVLNARRVLFIDVDRPPPPKTGLLSRLWGRAAAPAEDAQLSHIRDSLRAAASEASFRIYATAGGYRVIATDPTFEPGEPPAEDLMAAVGADPMFIQLCRAQRSFRARLTPKPWRCGLPRAPGQHPREEPSAEAEFAAWLRRYEAAVASKAVCRMLEKVGWGRVHEEAAAILRRHDDGTRATEPLPLA